MADFLTPEQRSERMSRIRSTNTRPEVALRRALHAMGLRYRLHRRDLPGKPDIVLSKYATAIFVHGCLWHRHEGCKIASTPKSNTEFWVEKFSRNVLRDKRHMLALKELGWKVVVVWECELASVERAWEAGIRIAQPLGRARFQTDIGSRKLSISTPMRKRGVSQK